MFFTVKRALIQLCISIDTFVRFIDWTVLHFHQQNNVCSEDVGVGVCVCGSKMFQTWPSISCIRSILSSCRSRTTLENQCEIMWQLVGMQYEKQKGKRKEERDRKNHQQQQQQQEKLTEIKSPSPK